MIKAVVMALDIMFMIISLFNMPKLSKKARIVNCFVIIGCAVNVGLIAV